MKICQVVTESTSIESDPVIKKIRNEALLDEDYKNLVKDVSMGFEKYKAKNSSFSALFWNIRDYLSVEDGLVLYGTRIVIPKNSRKENLQIVISKYGKNPHSLRSQGKIFGLRRKTNKTWGSRS